MKRKVMFAAVAALFAEGLCAQALPTGGSVTRGSGSIDTAGSSMTVTQTSQRAIFDFATYNIGSGASVTYAQPGASAVAVSRVPLSAGRSQIDGTLSANGHLMLLNPNGVLFGSSAVVNVGSLTATTGSINDDAFMAAAGAIAIAGATTGSIENRGTITAGGAGLVAFVAPSVINSGVISALGGRIVLAGAQAATVSLNGGLYEITVGEGVAGSSVANSGTLNATGGAIILSAPEAESVVTGAINLSGIQRANRIEVNGKDVVLSSDLDAPAVSGASGRIEVHNGAHIQDAVDIARTGATIDVHGGAYMEGHANVDYFGATGGGQNFGLHVYKDNLTIRGRKASGAALSGLDDADMPVVTAQYQTGFGAQHFISGSGVTIEGLKFKPVSTGNNKTVEVIGDNFTLKNSVIDNSGNATAAAFYISDFAIPGRPEVESFRLENNRFVAGTTASALVVVASGAGNSTPSSNRVFRNNQLIGNPALSGARGFQVQGQMVGIPWQPFTAGAVTVENNAFSDFDAPVRTVGIMTQALDWNSIFDGNTFTGGAALAFVGDTSTARASTVAVAAQDGSNTTNQITDTRITRGIQASIDRAQSGDTVRALKGTYLQSATLDVNKSITLRGAGQTGANATIIDARGLAAGNYGMKVTADNVTLSDFSLYGPTVDAGASYGIKVQPKDGNVASRLSNFTIRNVTTRGAGRAELDLHAVVGAVIDGVSAIGTPVGSAAGTTTKGAGIQITDSEDVVIRDSTTTDNAWGGVALYQSNRFYDQQTNNIRVESNNALHEVNPLYLQDESASKDFGTLSLQGFAFAVRNPTSVAGVDQSQYTWMQKTEQAAYDFAVDKVANPGSSYVQGWSGTALTQDFYVGIGNRQASGTGTLPMSIAQAIAAGADGATVHVGRGDFDQAVNLNARRNLLFDHSIIAGLTIGDCACGSGIGGIATAGGGGILVDAPIKLLSDTSLSTTGGDIAFNGDIQGAYGLTLNAGAGNVSLVSGGSQAIPLGKLTVAANNFTLSSTLWVSGYEINALGTVALSDHTLRSLRGGGTDAISAGGNVTGSTISESGVQIVAGGDVAANVTASGNVVVEATNVSGNYAAPTIAFQAIETVNATVDATGPVQVNAPDGAIKGNFSEVVNTGSGLIEVNGKPQPNSSFTEGANNNRVVPQEVTTAASREAGGLSLVTRRRRKPEDALEMLENGESIEIDLTPG